MNLNPKTFQAFQSHVLAEFPKEAVGFVIDGNYVPVPNSASDPFTTFRIDQIDHVKALAIGPIQAVLHSHPYDKFHTPKWPAEWPTTSDMDSWMEGDIPWGIVATDGEGLTQVVWLDETEVAPLEGRTFVHGISDCYSIIRDWYKLNRQITLPNFARGIEWWYAGRNLYDDNFKLTGFEPIRLEDAEVGDVVMMKAASPVTNHAAVIVGPNQILHHLFNRLSGIDSLSKWNRCIVRVVRYKGTQ